LAVRTAGRVEIDAQVAHQPFDDAAAQAVLRGQRTAARGRRPPGDDRLAISDHLRRVLHIAARHRADGRGAEADQVCGLVGGVALEIAVQPLGALALGQWIVGAGEMIEPDLLKAGADEYFGRRLALGKTFAAAR
jgi:hypothetical protein